MSDVFDQLKAAMEDPGPKLTPERAKELIEEGKKRAFFHRVSSPWEPRKWRWNGWCDVVLEFVWPHYSGQVLDKWTEGSAAGDCKNASTRLASFASCVHAAAIEEQRVKMACERMRGMMEEFIRKEIQRLERIWYQSSHDCEGGGL